MENFMNMFEFFFLIYRKFYKNLWKNVTKINLFYENVRIILRKLTENFKDFLKGSQSFLKNFDQKLFKICFNLFK